MASETNHPWCRDVSRDEAIREAEDAAAVPAIQHRDLPEAVAALTERVARLEAAQATLGSGDVFRDVGCGSTGDEIARLTAERDAALARVAELESVAAANAGGDAKPVLWGVVWGHKDLPEDVDTRNTEEEALNLAKSDLNNGTVIPLYDAPQPPRGWLTAEERALIESLRATFEQNADALRPHGLGGHVDNWERRVRLLDAILARETPPKVKVPHLDDLEADERPVWESACSEWIAAIREAGGEVEG